jgi:DNA-binding MarR family transcriptional regulator
MRFVTEEGITVGELHARARTARDSLTGLTRWGYVVVAPDPADARPEPPRDALVVRSTASGRTAQEIWWPLASLIEKRWRARFGTDVVGDLDGSLRALVGQFEVELPRYLPVVYPAANGKAEVPNATEPVPAAAASPDTPLDLSALLSQVLLAFTVDFERASRISLPISANTLRVLDDAGVRVRDLSRLTGVSREANSMAVGFLARHRCAIVHADPSARRGKVVRLTAKGQRAQEKYRRALAHSEELWRARFGEDDIAQLRQALEHLVGDPATPTSPLMGGLDPYPEGWRAMTHRPQTLPHYPMVLHRGGFPDGS